MTLTKTPINGIDVPDHSQNINQGWADTARVAVELETFTVMRFASMNDLTAKLVASNAPKEGMVAWLNDQNALYAFDGSTWLRVYPVARMTYIGTTAPASTLGATGDLYLQV